MRPAFKHSNCNYASLEGVMIFPEFCCKFMIISFCVMIIRSLFIFYEYVQTPIQTMSGHTEAVSSIQWTNSTDILSSGWDHSIRLWDAQTGVNKDTLVRYSFAQFLIVMAYILRIP